MTIKCYIRRHVIRVNYQRQVVINTNPDLDSKVDNVFDDEFYLDGVNQLTDKTVLEAVCPYACNIVGIGVKVDEQRTAGTLDFVVTKNGSPIAGTSLNIQLNGSYPLHCTATVAHRSAGYVFAAGDILRVQLTSTAWTPLSNRCKIFVIIKNE